jgi:altronate dehydratase small subunit
MRVECFQIDPGDNVATLLQDAAAGDEVTIRGALNAAAVTAPTQIRAGHKIALRPIAEGERIIKYGQTIGAATRPISPGEWVHLQNCRSLYDAKSSSLDLESGARKETRYA